MYRVAVFSSYEGEIAVLREEFGAKPLGSPPLTRLYEFLVKGEHCLLGALGIGPLNFSLNLGWTIGQHGFEKALLIGSAGSMPGSGLSLQELVVARAELFWEARAVEGAADLEPPLKGLFTRLECPRIALEFGERYDLTVADMLTVVTPSRDPGEADMRYRITGARCENMEGYAFFSALKRHRLEGVELRCISNEAGKRDKSMWKLQEAEERVQVFVGKLLKEGVI